MKKLFLFMLLPLMAVAMNACDGGDDEGGRTTGSGSAQYDGQTYTLKAGAMLYYGDEYSEDSETIELALVSNIPTGDSGPDHGIFFNMHVSNGNTKPTAGTYTYADTYAPGTFSSGYIMSDDVELDITGGTVTVAISGTKYTISFNCTVETGGSITGSFTGTLLWYDETVENGSQGGGGGVVDEPSGPGNASENTVHVGSESYLIAGGTISYWGDFYETGVTESILIKLTNQDGSADIDLNLLVPDGSTTLIPGRYDFGDDYSEPFTILPEESSVENTAGQAAVTGGYITVSKEGQIYTIIFALETEAGPLTGRCSRALVYEVEA